MRVNIIFLDYQRHDFTQRVKDKNFNNAGYPFDHVVIDLHGVSAALNTGIQLSKDYDAVVLMANDILMPDNWLFRMVEAAMAIPQTGMVAVHCVEQIGEVSTVNGINVHVQPKVFGNCLIPFTAIRQIGYFNPDYDPYGMQDSDYCYRLNCTGHLNYYLHNMKADHIGHDVGDGSDYRAMKDEGLSAVDEKWRKWTGHYQDTGDFSINIPEWPE